MNNVTSKPLVSENNTKPARPAPSSSGCALLIGKIGMWLTVASFGGIFWAVNGGFSVIGLGILASAFNSAGMLFWAAVSSFQFPVPVAVPGLPTTQPLIPWIGVVAASLLQISVACLKLSGRHVPAPLFVTAVLVSIYDYVTTVVGLGTVSWIAFAGLPAQILLAIPLTFVLEIAIGYVLRR